MLNRGEYLVAGEIKNTMKCEPNAFVGGEIFGSMVDNECYCDDKGFVDITYIQSEITWWTTQVEEIRAQEAQAKADAEAEAARMQISFDSSSL